MSSWQEWVQDVGGGVIGQWANAKYSQPYEVQKLQLQALGDAGYYREGQAGTAQPVRVTGLDTSTILLLGAAVVAVLMLKD